MRRRWCPDEGAVDRCSHLVAVLLAAAEARTFVRIDAWRSIASNTIKNNIYGELVLQLYMYMYSSSAFELLGRRTIRDRPPNRVLQRVK